jgi:hypothetical protein
MQICSTAEIEEDDEMMSGPLQPQRQPPHHISPKKEIDIEELHCTSNEKKIIIIIIMSD